MAMFDDPKKELKKLEEQLLQDDEWLERELAAARELIGEDAGQTPVKSKKSKTQSYGKADASLRGSEQMQKKAARVVVPKNEDYDLDEQPRKNNRGLVILAILETLGIVAVVAYWLMFLL